MKNLFYIFAVAMAAMSCSGKSDSGKSEYEGYSKTDNGLHYNIVEDKTGKNAVVSNYMKVQIEHRDMNESVLIASTVTTFPIEKVAFNGDIMEGLAMLSVGDSASFVVNTEAFFMKTIGAPELPPFAAKNKTMKVNIRVLDIKTQDEYVEAENLMKQELERQYEQLKEQEALLLQEYLKQNKITQRPTASGLIFIPVSPGKGPKLMAGQTIRCHLTGKLIDGQEFESTLGRDPEVITVGSPELIDGLNEALLMMSPGGKAKVILPSSIGFGESDISSPIPPFSTLIFELNVLN